MKVTDVERILVNVPFTERQQRITQRTVYNWSILELCKVTTDSGHIGWGETVIHYTHARVTDASVNRVIGSSPADLMNDDSLGAGYADRRGADALLAAAGGERLDHDVGRSFGRGAVPRHLESRSLVVTRKCPMDRDWASRSTSQQSTPTASQPTPSSRLQRRDSYMPTHSQG